MKKVNKLVSLVLALAMCLTLAVPAMAVESSATSGSCDTSLEDSCQKTVLTIEDALSLDGTSVEAEMAELIGTFQAKQKNSSEESYQKLQVLIDSAKELLNAYMEYQRNGVAPTSASGATKVGIAAIVTYFNSQSCYLSAELLIHMGENNSLDSIYIPEMVTALRQQSCWNTYRNGYPSSGSGEFSTSNSNKDLYYAIHLYNWTRNDSTNRITLSDRYDFDYNDRYNGLAETATNFLALAQNRGEILPFYTTVYNL